MLEGLINADKQIVLGVDSLYTTPDGEETFEGESKGIAQADRSKILEAINKLSKKTYYINKKLYNKMKMI